MVDVLQNIKQSAEKGNVTRQCQRINAARPQAKLIERARLDIKKRCGVHHKELLHETKAAQFIVVSTRDMTLQAGRGRDLV